MKMHPLQHAYPYITAVFIENKNNVFSINFIDVFNLRFETIKWYGIVSLSPTKCQSRRFSENFFAIDSWCLILTQRVASKNCITIVGLFSPSQVVILTFADKCRGSGVHLFKMVLKITTETGMRLKHTNVQVGLYCVLCQKILLSISYYENMPVQYTESF